MKVRGGINEETADINSAIPMFRSNREGVSTKGAKPIAIVSPLTRSPT
jgi:hypothetical protein